MLAARGDHTEAVMTLVDAGADITLRNEVAKFLELLTSCYSCLY